MSEGKTSRILLVDDSMMLRKVAASTLSNVGSYSVDEAADAREALDLLSRFSYDALITDYYMPGLDGIEFTKVVRNIDDFEDTPIIMITSEKDPYVEREAKAAGVDAFLIKPLDPAALRATLRQLLAVESSDSKAPLRFDAQTVVDAIPYPVMVLDRRHHVVLGNATFWSQSGAGIDDAGLVCMRTMHANGLVPAMCPLREAIRSGDQAHAEVIEPDGTRNVVTIFPMDAYDEDGEQLYLHMTRPAG